MSDKLKQFMQVVNAMQTLRERHIADELGQDPKHGCLYNEFGYEQTLTFKNFYDKYRRQGIMGGVIDAFNSKAFETNPEIIEGTDENQAQTTNEKEFAKFAKRTNLWGVYLDACIRRSVGSYSAIIVQIKDNKRWDQKAENVSPDDIVKFIPCWQNQIQVSQYNQDEQSDNYGEPVLWSYREIDFNAVTKEAPSPSSSKTIHASRVIYFGDVYQNGTSPILGNLMLQKGYNDGVTLEKLIGAGGEGAYKNAARHIATSFDKETDLQDIANMLGVPMSELGDVLDEITRDVNSNFDAGLFAKAATYTVLSTNLPDMRETFDNALSSFASSLGLPTAWVAGTQTGERASTENEKQVAKRITSYREITLEPEINKMLSSFDTLGLWQGVEWSVKWDSLLEPSIGEKLANAKLMMEINGPMGEMFTTGEIRVAAGYEAEPELTEEEQRLLDEGEDDTSES